MHGGASHNLSCSYQKIILDTLEKTTVRRGLLNCRRCRRYQRGAVQNAPDGSIPTLKNSRGLPLYIYRPWLSGTLECKSRGGAGLPVYLHSIQGRPFRIHQWHVNRAITSLPEIYRQAWHADNWQCFIIQLTKSTVNDAWTFTTTSPNLQTLSNQRRNQMKHYYWNDPPDWKFLRTSCGNGKACSPKRYWQDLSNIV